MNEKATVSQNSTVQGKDCEVTISKDLVRYLYEKDCFLCKWSNIEPADFVLRCCNPYSEHCSEDVDKSCAFFEKEKEKVGFDIALVKLIQGKRIRRGRWPARECVEQFMGRLRRFGPSSKPDEEAEISKDDLLAMDWEILE